MNEMWETERRQEGRKSTSARARNDRNAHGVSSEETSAAHAFVKLKRGLAGLVGVAFRRMPHLLLSPIKEEGCLRIPRMFRTASSWGRRAFPRSRSLKKGYIIRWDFVLCKTNGLFT